MSRVVVIALGIEGGGAQVFGERTEGRWWFWREGTSMSLDDNDDEYWESFRTERVADLAQALPSIWPLMVPDAIHPEFRTWFRARRAAAMLALALTERRAAEARAGDWDRALDDSGLTPEQRQIVEFGDGPLVVIAGAGTGKTRVIVERVRYLLAHREGLLPEQVLVLTYNVKAARELQLRLDEAVGPTTRARMSVANFHGFCQRILTESAADAGLPRRPEVLDGVAQTLVLKELRASMPLIYHHGEWWLADVVQFINRAKDELVSPDAFDAFVAKERQAFESRNGAFDEAAARLESQGNLKPLRVVRSAYARVRKHERAVERGEPTTGDAQGAAKVADREARRSIAGTGEALARGKFDAADYPRIDALAASYVTDGAALDVLRLTELAAIYRAYETALAERGALDFGEQIAATARLFMTRPNVLRRWQQRYRYLLVDEFQDANIAQIQLVELLGRIPGRPDNVMVVGDDDQSIYRFRGASFAAFTELDARFSRPAAHAPDAPPRGPPPRRRIDQNFRSVGHILTAANRLIECNATRFEPDKRLVTDRPDGAPVELVVASGAADEAVAIVDAIKALAGEETGRDWSDMAVLYRKHKHREAIAARLRDEDIPYTVVGGVSLFATPEIRDLEQAMRAIANPNDDVALVRMMTAGPWRLDALEILRVSRMAYLDEAHLLETAKAIVETGEVATDAMPAPRKGEPAIARLEVSAGLRAKLRQLAGTLDDLSPLTFREGPHTILESFLERSGQVLDLIAADTLESKRIVARIASFLRFVKDWQAANPTGTLAGFVSYLDAYQAAGGKLPTSVELTENVEGVRLMTLYQAKGLEFPIVFVPQLLEGEWPAPEPRGGIFPRELLREAIPAGDVHIDEERRLLYVAMTRAQERLILTTHGGPAAAKEMSRFVAELLNGNGDDVRIVDRTASNPASASPGDASASPTDRLLASIRRVMPLPTDRERRFALRLRASELVGLMEGTRATDPEATAARDALTTELTRVAHSAATSADDARAQGLDPLTFRSLALDSGSGANLLQIAPLPARFSYSSLNTYESCPLRYALRYVYRMPTQQDPVAALTFGSTAHEAFEAFTASRRERTTRGDSPPSREDLEREFRSRWVPSGFADKATEESYQRRIGTLLDNFWEGEVASLSAVICEERDFELTLNPGDGSAPVIVTGSIDRIDRLPSGGLEVIDYKTGKVASQKHVDQSLQLSIYALACRDALGLGTPERVTLLFTESALRCSTTRADAQLDLSRADVLARVARMRAGDFAATPSDKACRWCDYARMCPQRAT